MGVPAPRTVACPLHDDARCTSVESKPSALQTGRHDAGGSTYYDADGTAVPLFENARHYVQHELDRERAERRECVPGGPSVACSTPEALAWDAALAAVTDPSGRAVRGVHAASY